MWIEGRLDWLRIDPVFIFGIRSAERLGCTATECTIPQVSCLIVVECCVAQTVQVSECREQ